MLPTRVIALVFCALVLPAQPQTFDLAIRDARLVHGDGRVTARATVLISGGRIRQIVDRTAAAATRTIDARGHTLIPGLIDAHVHVEPWSLPLFLRHGVTTVRDLHNDPAFTFALAREPLARERPRVVAAGAALDGSGSAIPGVIAIDDVGEARGIVRRLIADGAGVISIYPRLSPSLVAVVVQEARARGVPVAAHLGRTTAAEAAGLGVASIEHLSGVPESAAERAPAIVRAHDDFWRGWTASALAWPTLQPQALDRVVQRMTEQQVALVPTLVLHETCARLDDARMLRERAASVPAEGSAGWDATALVSRAGWNERKLEGFRRTLPALQRFVAAFAHAGGRVAAGTDAGREFVVPGESLHRELELYVAAGLSPHDALRTATANAAALLGLANLIGTIEEGHDADLVLVDGDPLADIRATRRIVAVIHDGLEVPR